MTETLIDPGSTPPPPPHRRLERDEDHKIIAGVCAGFGRYTGTDPVIWRITLAVLTVFGGVGVVIYALGWLFMPSSRHSCSVGERLLRRPFHFGGRNLVAVLAVILVVVIIGGFQHRAPAGLGVLAVVLVFILTMRHLDGRKAPTGSEAIASNPTAPLPAAAAGLAPAPVPFVRTPPKPRSRLGQITLSLSLLVSGILVALRLNGADSLTAPRIIAVALVVVAGGLVVGAWIGRARWLIAIAALLALAIAPAAVAENAVRDGAGNRTWVPAAASTSSGSSLHYKLGVGEGKLDLTSLPKGGIGAPIIVRVRFGHLLVIVPTNLRLHVIAHAGVGDVLIFDENHGGTQVDQDVTIGPVGLPVQELDLKVGVGQVEVRRA